MQYTGVAWLSVTVYDTPGGALSSIYEDAGMTVPKANPFANFGNYTFYAAPGKYIIQGDITQLVGGDPTPVFEQGYWSPLMTGGGASSEMILTSDGDAIMVWTPL